MKFAMNGGLIIGTLDGANIEIRQEIGEENIFIFGALADQVDKIREKGRVGIDWRLFDVLMAIQNGVFGNNLLFQPLIANLWSGDDYYLISNDFASYIEAQERIDKTYSNTSLWSKMCIKSTALMGKFFQVIAQ